MEITATELKINLGKYLAMSNQEPIVVTKNGKAIAKLIGSRSYSFDLSELCEIGQETVSCMLGETISTEYGTGASVNRPRPVEAQNTDCWLLTRNGEPVAQLTPILKQKKKRQLGFMGCEPASDETIASLFESDFTGEDYERWLNQEI